MLKVLGVFLLSLTTKAQEEETKLLESFSLIPPHVGANGREPYFDFKGDYLIKTRSRKDYTQIGYAAKESSGAILSKEQIRNNDIQIIIDFYLKDVSAGGNESGFGFWLCDEINHEQGFYGRNRKFNGVGAVIDLKGSSPYVKYVDSHGVHKSGVYLKKNNDEIYRIIFTKKGGELTVQLVLHDQKHTLYSGKVKIPRRLKVGVTGYTGNSTTTIQVIRLITNSLTGKKVTYVKGNREGKSGIIMVFGVVAILALAYYLYQREKKDFELKE